MNLLHRLLPAIALGASGLVLGGVAAEEARQVERIRAERAAADALYVQQVRECSLRFIVTSCVDAARAERHAVHARLDREQQALDSAQRQQRAADRLQAIESKTSGAEAESRAQAARERSASGPGGAAPRPLPVPASAAAARTPKPAPDSAERAAQEARARTAYEIKQLQAEAHRQEVARRNEERARKANPGAPLPTPPAASATAR